MFVSLTSKVSSVCTTRTLGLIKEEKSQKAIHGLASLQQAIKSSLEAECVASCRLFKIEAETCVFAELLSVALCPQRCRDLWH